MDYFGHFYLDLEKDMIVDLFLEQDRMSYVLRTPNHNTGNLITNLARMCGLPLTYDASGKKIIEGTVPSYIDQYNRTLYIFRLGNTKVANIYPDGTIEMKASIPSISKTLMSQTKEYRLDISKTIIKTYILTECKFRTDLHTHMNANLSPDVLIALGIFHQIRYPLYYVKKLSLHVSDEQKRRLEEQRAQTARQFANSELKGHYLDRKIDDNTFINFADLILNDPEYMEEKISRIRTSLAILKDGQAVFTNLEKVYLYRYVFTKGIPSEKRIHLHDIDRIPDSDIASLVQQMIADSWTEEYRNNTLFQNKLLWIARTYQNQGIRYAEISDTTLVKKYDSLRMLNEVHAVMPAVYRETGVRLRFLAGIRRIPLTIVKDRVTADNYLTDNLEMLRGIAMDPYVAGSDIIGEEINDIRDLKQVIGELVDIARENPGFTIRIHAGENDSLKDNVANSIRCVMDALKEGEKAPHIRIGHGLYTANLRSAKGQELIRAIKEHDVVLEFQITSNVRLNNLSFLKNHPLKQYLRAGIRCVQGTDGAALYGTNSIDEQLSLEKLLNLNRDELISMRAAEEAIRVEQERVFQRKMDAFLADGRPLEQICYERMQKAESPDVSYRSGPARLDSGMELKDQIEELPWDRFPVILAGGSFNNDRRATSTTDRGRALLLELMEQLDPDKVFFVIGHSLSGYEKYLEEHNTKGFRIFAIVPSLMTKAQTDRLRRTGVRIRVSTESEPMGLYKSFNYEIFERRPSAVIAMDGNSAGSNLIQEAKNGKGKSRIFVSRSSTYLRRKAQSLEGYVTMIEPCPEDAGMIRDTVESALNSEKHQEES
ncbi:MAG: hypothetical protein IKG46_10300 [Solobacterium sp.]|nr:hypothetical protein [Solobacterium sp.]